MKDAHIWQDLPESTFKDIGPDYYRRVRQRYAWQRQLAQFCQEMEAYYQAATFGARVRRIVLGLPPADY